jgi:hypothetical protein
MKRLKTWERVGTNPNVEKDYNPKAFKEWINIPSNLESFYNNGDVKGRFIESVIEQKEGSKEFITENQNTKGKDVVRQGVDGEIKTTSTVCNLTTVGLKYKTCYFQIGGLISKRGPKGTKKDIIIVDAVNFRRFEVPHDDFYYGDFQFNEVKATTRSGKNDLTLLWYADYNTEKYYINKNLRSPFKSNNTELILKYEVK